MKRFKPNTSQRNKLLGTITQFNRKVEKLGLNSDYRVTYSKIMKDIFTKRGFDQRIKAMARIFKANAGDIIENKYGVRMTRWERDTINYLLPTVNRQRAIFKESYVAQAENSVINPNAWAPLSRRGRDIKNQRDLSALLKSYWRMGSYDYNKVRYQEFMDNFDSSIEWMMDLPQGRELKKLIDKTDTDVIARAVADRYSPTSIWHNYPTIGVTDEDILIEEAQQILDEWRAAIKKHTPRK